MSAPARGILRPKARPCRARCSTSALYSIVFDGMQPRRMHSPPRVFAPSTMATRLPSDAATRAALKPALPPPMTMNSYGFTRTI